MARARGSGTASPIASRVSGMTCVPAGATVADLLAKGIHMWSAAQALRRHMKVEASCGTGFAPA